MINMGNDAEIANMRCVHLQNSSGGTACRRPKNFQSRRPGNPPKREKQDSRTAVEEKEI
jgi:hypothetical protein